MNKQRIMPLVFTFTFALFAPLLALGNPVKKPGPARSTVSGLLDKIDSGAEAAWTKWHEKNQAYAALVDLDQR